MYNDLDKDLKRKAKLKFFKSKNGILQKKRFIRINVFVGLLFLYSLCLLIFNSGTWVEYYLIVLSIINSILILIFSYKIKIKLINEFLSKNQSK